MKKQEIIKINLIELINNRYQALLNETDSIDENAKITELQMHKMLFIIFGQFYVRFQRELFDCNFQAWKYGPVEINYRNFFKSEKNSKEFKKVFDIEVNKVEYNYLIKLIDKFLKFSPWWLVDFTHSMDAWMFHYNESDLVHDQEIPKDEIVDSLKRKDIKIIEI